MKKTKKFWSLISTVAIASVSLLSVPAIAAQCKNTTEDPKKSETPANPTPETPTPATPSTDATTPATPVEGSNTPATPVETPTVENITTAEEYGKYVSEKGYKVKDEAAGKTLYEKLNANKKLWYERNSRSIIWSDGDTPVWKTEASANAVLVLPEDSSVNLNQNVQLANPTDPTYTNKRNQTAISSQITYEFTDSKLTLKFKGAKFIPNAAPEIGQTEYSVTIDLSAYKPQTTESQPSSEAATTTPSETAPATTESTTTA
ncbi:hypothetical protein [Mycoplasma sp. 3341]|uniref:hypothetical protein n=1 Tax=Mycoplasma sp. 3341 TaxID=3447506 RepID=UPI003F660291